MAQAQPELSGRRTLARFVLLRGLAFIYVVAFLCLLRQWEPLIGARGLLPARLYLDGIRGAAAGSAAVYLYAPTLFWLGCSDAVLRACAWAGLALSAAALGGLANAPLMGALWLLYMSFVHVGQVFYGYGWEMMLLEAGFLAIFLAPPWDPRPFQRKDPPPAVLPWLFRWMLFRVMFGAGMIKLRGDSCWRDLTCLLYHYETQPIPHPLSWYFHHLPAWVNKAGVLFNHFVELIVPWLLFGPRRARAWAGGLIALFQVALILSGNLSFLNWLTLVLCFSCFDDGAWARVLPERLVALARPAEPPCTRPRRAALLALAGLVAILSVSPALNMLSPRQAMNASFDPLGLVNAYGAFGSVGRVRREIVLQGTLDPDPANARWTDYEFKCKPGDPGRRPCLVTPFHWRLDWQMWFAAMESPRENLWLAHLVYKLLMADRKTLGLLDRDPFAGKPPRWIRAELYEYRFSDPGSKDWWVRSRVGPYLPPLSADDPQLADLLTAMHWEVR
ncbi:MAG TPA: lipase maturation factor family protein [Elusimicrobiota bacterium]|nr:lipase maturation factor family protein [Elusimicrobiota bacterium]